MIFNLTYHTFAATRLAKKRVAYIFYHTSAATQLAKKKNGVLKYSTILLLQRS